MSTNPTSSYGQAKVHVWETKVGDEEGNGSSVGHTSIELESSTGEKNYFSFRPSWAGAVNPVTALIPTPGYSETPEGDRSIEGSEPDRTISIPATKEEYDAMNGEIGRLKDDAQTGKHLYCLFPRVSLLRPLQWLGLAKKPGHEAFSRCPFSDREMGDKRHEKFAGLQESKAGHCATTVHEIMGRAMKMPGQSRTPWSIHPSHLGDLLEKVKGKKTP